MTVEIIGTQFVNKGAELMLLSIINEFKKRKSNIKFCMEPNSYFSPYNKLAPLGIYMKLPYNKKGINFRIFNKLISNNFKKAYGLISDEDIDIFLDASGFLYSEQWGKNSPRKLATSIKKWKRQGSKVILLPQAFGPFNSDAIKKNMKVIINNADLIFAREKKSYDYLCSIDGKKDNIILAPDFTNLLEIQLDTNSLYTNKICIIPNQRMLDKTSNGKEYLSILGEIINLLDQNKKEYFFLIHEGKEDKEIINKLKLKQEALFVESTDALEIKKIIGESKGVIGSRFHGLVSSLAQGNPVIALGWSHKYYELLNDYNIEKYFYNFKDSNITDLMKLFLDETVYNNISKIVKNNSIVLKKESNNMWKQVFDKLDVK
jgi:polysaccharide pyruvyl transferase WcaK-like protein